MSSNRRQVQEGIVLEAPVFYPTLEEWNENDPITYLERVVRPQAESAGICKIVPPSGWKPPFAVENARFKFATRVQLTNRLEASSRVKALFDQKLRKFCFIVGAPLARPVEGDETPEWLSLYREVTARGGSDHVTALDEWADILKKVRINGLYSKVSAKELRTMYNNVLRDFESFYFLGKKRAPPRPRRNQLISPMKNATESIRRSDRMARKDEDAEYEEGAYKKKWKGSIEKDSVDRRYQSDEPNDSFTKMYSTLPRGPRAGDTFWKWFVDEGKCSFGTVGQVTNADRKKPIWAVTYVDHDGTFFNRYEEGEDLALALACGESEAEAKEAFEKGVCQICSRANSLPKMTSCDSCECRFHDFCLLQCDQPISDKHLNWFCPICLEETRQSLLGMEVSRSSKASEDSESDTEDLDALREAIDFSPVTKTIGVKQLAAFGFPDGEKFSMDEFMANDTHFREKYERNAKKKVFNSDDAIEDEFWKIAKGQVPFRVEVNYGNDLDTGALGSGFPTKEKMEKQQRKWERLGPEQRKKFEAYVTSAWNLNNLPTSHGSLLQHIGANISGVIVPWLYVGMTFSAFCFHVEDHNFSSINYHHRGASKSWWGAPASGADIFERVAREVSPELFEARPDLLQGIVTHFDPSLMASRGVPMYHLIQRPGEYVVTFPRAYHGGFNHGFNCAEAVNFAGRGWLSFGPQAVERYAILRKVPVVAHEALLLSIAAWCLSDTKDYQEVIRTCYRLVRPLALMAQIEKQQREHVKELLLRKRRKLKWLTAQEAKALSSHSDLDLEITERVTRSKNRHDSTKNEEQVTFNRSVFIMGRVQNLSTIFNGVPRCSVCKRYCPLSHAVDRNDSARYVCLEHANADCIFAQSYDLESLDEFVSKIAAKAAEAEQWIERANRLCKGEKQPDAILGKELAGGVPFAFNSKKVSQSEGFPPEDLTFAHISEWRCKPDLAAANRMVEMDAANLVEEASVWKEAVDKCKKWYSTAQHTVKLLSTSHDGSRTPRATVSMSELDDLVTTFCSLPMQPPSEGTKLVENLKHHLGYAKDLQAQALKLVESTKQHPQDDRTLLSQIKQLEKVYAGILNVDDTSRELVQRQMQVKQWILQARQLMKKKQPLVWQECDELLRQYKEQNDPGSVSPPKEKMTLDMYVANASSFTERIASTLQQSIVLHEISKLRRQIQAECPHLLPANFDLLTRKETAVLQWTESVSAVLNAARKCDDLHQLRNEGRIRLNVAKGDPSMMMLSTLCDRVDRFLSRTKVYFPTCTSGFDNKTTPARSNGAASSSNRESDFVVRREDFFAKHDSLSARPSLTAIEVVVSEADDLPASLISELSSLQNMVKAGRKWVDKVYQKNSSCLCKDDILDPLAKYTKAQLWTLLDESLALEVAPPESAVLVLYGSLLVRECAGQTSRDAWTSLLAIEQRDVAAFDLAMDNIRKHEQGCGVMRGKYAEFAHTKIKQLDESKRLFARKTVTTKKHKTKN